MSGPAGILAVLDETQDWLYRSSESRGDDDRAEAVKQARAAVAELIEAADEMNRLAKGPTGGVSQSDKRAIIARMDAALANIGSAQ